MFAARPMATKTSWPSSTSIWLPAGLTLSTTLAFLAQQMIDLNKQKQAEVKRFLGWLGADRRDDRRSQRQDVHPGLPGRLSEGRGAPPFAELYDRLHNNRSKIAANLTDRAFETRIRREYEGAWASCC